MKTLSGFAIAAVMSASSLAFGADTAPQDGRYAKVAAMRAAVEAALANRSNTAKTTSTSGTKAQGNSSYPGTPMANPYRAYPPSCAAYPLPDKASGPYWQAQLPLYTKSGATGATVTSEYVTATVWRIACSSSGDQTPYNPGGYYNAMTLLRIDRSAQKEGSTDTYPSMPMLLVKQYNIDYTMNASLVRPAIEPNTTISEVPFDSPIIFSTTYVLENYAAGSDYNHQYSDGFKLLVEPYLGSGSPAPVEFQIPSYEPKSNTYPDAFLALPIDGYTSGAWYDPNHPGEGLMTQVLGNDDGSRTLFAAWYTYDAYGLPFWLHIQGTVQPGDIKLDNVPVYYHTGGGFAGNFTSSVPNTWGTMSLSFPDCNTVKFSYNGNAAGVTGAPGGTGSRTWKHLTNINGLSCE